MTKRLDETAMESELAGSAFFSSPAPEGTEPRRAPVPADTFPPQPTSEPSPATLNASPFARTPVRRTITRCAFEFYQDQLDRLRRYALEAKARGEKGSMSEMVREAVDLYLSGHRPGG